MNPPTPSSIRLEVQSGAVHATLDRPDHKNALDSPTLRDLDAVCDWAEENPTVRVLVLGGAGGVFCAGGDLTEFQKLLGPGRRDTASAHNRLYGALLTRLDRLPVPVIARVEGVAFGGAVGLVAVADIAITTKTALLSVSETTLGLVPAQIAPFLVRRVGLHVARRLALTGARVDGRQAVDLGLCDVVCDSESDAAAAVDSHVAQVRRCAPAANRATRALLASAGTTPLEPFLDLAAQRFADHLHSDEAAEGLSAFVAKRSPTWAKP